MSGARTVAEPDHRRTLELAGNQHQLPVSEPTTGSVLHSLLSWVPWRQVQSATDRVQLHYRSAVAIEAMTSGPDAINSGHDLIVLPPSGRWSGRWGVRLHEPL